VTNIPLSALDGKASACKLIEEVASRIKAIIQSQGGTFAELQMCMSELNELQLAQIPVELVCGGSYTDNIPYGLGTEMSVDYTSGAEHGMSLAEANPNTRIAVRYGIHAYDFIARNVHAILSFLDVPATQSITVNSVLTLMAHSAFRDAYMAGNLVSMHEAGYIIPVKGGIYI